MSAEAGRVELAEQSGSDVRTLRRMWVEAFNRRDLERTVSFYSEDAVELPLNGEPAVNGIEAIRELMKSMFAAGFSEVKVMQTQVGYTEPLAVELATYTIRPPDGRRRAQQDKGRLVATWRRGATGQFKITISVWSREFSEPANWGE
jgi:uncharacterized protein (TIGR02246 family)